MLWYHSASSAFHNSYIKSSLGWNTKEKKKEFFNDLSRFLVMQSDDGNSDLLGFTVFRFEYEEEEDLLYWYSIFSAPEKLSPT